MLGATGASYLTGSRVYRGGFPNPNSGTVDPSGYITRGLNQSNRRSGLAATALRLHQQQTKPTTPVNLSPATTGTHTVQTTSTGKIQLVPINPPTAPTAPNNVLPFDSQSAAQQLLLQKQNNDFMNSVQQGRQKLAEDTTSQERAVDLAAPGKYRQLLDNFASRGMANSSGYGYQYGVTADDIANQKADLERQLQEGLANYDAQTQKQLDDYNLALGQSQTGSAEGMTPDDIAGLAGAQLPQKFVKPPVKKTAAARPKPPAKKTSSKKVNQEAAKRIMAKKKKGPF